MVGIGFFDLRNGRATQFAKTFHELMSFGQELVYWNGERKFQWQNGDWVETQEASALSLVFYHYGDHLTLERRVSAAWPGLSAKIIYLSTTEFSKEIAENEICFTQAWPAEAYPLTEAYLRQAIAWAEGGPPPSLIKPDQDLRSALHLLCQGYLAIVAGDHAERKTKVQAQDWWKIIKDAPPPSTASDEENTLLTAIRDRQRIDQEMVAAACRALDQSAA